MYVCYLASLSPQVLVWVIENIFSGNLTIMLAADWARQLRRGKVLGKDCGRGNERLDAKAPAVYHVNEGDGGGSKIPLESPACFSFSKSVRSFNKETLHVVIHLLLCI